MLCVRKKVREREEKVFKTRKRAKGVLWQQRAVAGVIASFRSSYRRNPKLR